MRPIAARPLWGGRFLSGARLGQAPGAVVRCCPNPNAPPGQEMPCYDAEGKVVYYSGSQASWGQCAVPTAPPPPAEGEAAPPAAAPAGLPTSPAAPAAAQNMLVEKPPSQFSYPIVNMTFPSGMEEPPLQHFTQLPSGTPAPQSVYQMAPQPTTVYPQAPAPTPPPPSYPPGAPIPVQDWFGLCRKKAPGQYLPQPPA